MRDLKINIMTKYGVYTFVNVIALTVIEDGQTILLKSAPVPNVAPPSGRRPKNKKAGK